MQIVVTNDDGIMAPGIRALTEALKDLGDIYLIAPTEERSATGHGITIRDPIRTRRVKVEGTKEAWAVDGTPADCVKLALKEFAYEDCGLVISGINNGPNLGTDVLYSGTVSAAIEGALLGVPSMAVSLASFEFNDYSAAAEIAGILTRYLKDNRKTLPPNTILNVNIPPVKKELFAGFRVTRLGFIEYEDEFDRRIDPQGNPYFWMKGRLAHKEIEPDVDVVAVSENYISITPVHFDLTNHLIIDRVKKWGIEGYKL